MNVEILTELISQRIADLRSTLRLITKPDFNALYIASDNKKWLNSLIERGDIEPLKIWYHSKLSDSIGDKSIRELREIARVLVIPEYTRLNKSLLLAEIVKRQTHARESVASNNSNPRCDATTDNRVGS